MSYLVLARKYRPRTFAELAGQETLTATLRGAIEEGRIGHAYLFSGPRGTGKTTTARILAKALNCEKGPTPEPCGTCERCVAADNGSEVDIVEIDAASNRGINEIRELRDSVGYRPLRARFKVFIVDEVHMLTEQAVNAFLKTLEEPPPHVKFFFATTEPEKLLPTFLSRCQVIRLALIPDASIVARLAHVFAAEQVHPGPGVLEELARRSRGGLRDALSLAEQLLSLVGAAPVLEDLARLSGEGGAEAIEDLLERVEAGDRAGVVRTLAASSGSETDLLASLLDHVRASLVAHLCGADTPLVEAEPALRARIAARGTRLGVERLQIWLEELLHARERIEIFKGAHARLLLEVTLFDLCRVETSLPIAEIEQRLLALERRLEGAPAAAASPRTSGAPDHAPRPLASRPDTVGPGAQAAQGAQSAHVLQPQPPRRFPDAVEPAPVARDAPRAPEVREPTRAEAATASVRAGSRAVSSDERAQPATPAPRERPPANAIEGWNRFLDALQTNAASLAEVLRARGRLGDVAGGRARIRLSNVRDEDRALVTSARSIKTCSAAFTRIYGEPIEVAFEDAGGPTRASKDAFTGHVTELFGGRIEDEG